MPAEDRYHPAVVRALVKNGWEITGQPVSLKVSKRRLWVDSMDNVKEKLKKALESYTGKGLNDFAYLTANSDESLFTIVDIADIRGAQLVETSLIVRLIGSKIVIDYDDNNKPLVEALIQTGIPREQIILAYEGESAPAIV